MEETPTIPGGASVGDPTTPASLSTSARSCPMTPILSVEDPLEPLQSARRGFRYGRRAIAEETVTVTDDNARWMPDGIRYKAPDVMALVPSREDYIRSFDKGVESGFLRQLQQEAATILMEQQDHSKEEVAS